MKSGRCFVGICVFAALATACERGPGRHGVGGSRIALVLKTSNNAAAGRTGRILMDASVARGEKVPADQRTKIGLVTKGSR